MTIRVGVIGAGSMGAGHAVMLARQISNCSVRAVADADAARAAAVAAQTRSAQPMTDGLALIHDDGVDAVVVASPDATHEALVLECLRLGKPVLCEKPLAASVDGCRQIVEAEIKGGRRLVQVGFMRRFDPGYQAMKQAIREETHGAPLFLHCVHRNAVAASYTTSEMIILNTAVHELDTARFLFDDEFASITVRGSRASRLAPDRRPQFLVLETRSGVIVDIEAFVDAQYGYDVRAELVCEKGAITLAQTSYTSSYTQNSLGQALHGDWIGRFSDAYRIELQAWIDSIASGMQIGASAWDGYIATLSAQTCLDAYRTAETRSFAIPDRPGFYS